MAKFVNYYSNKYNNEKLIIITKFFLFDTHTHIDTHIQRHSMTKQLLKIVDGSSSGQS